MTASDEEALWPAHRQAAAIAGGTLSSRDLLERFIERIGLINSKLNAVITTDFDNARVAADRADRAVGDGAELGALHGLPITIKDALETAGLRSTGGAAELKDHLPTRDAGAVAAVRSAGAIVIGKTNLPKWSGDVQAFNDLFGTTVNPRDATRVPGGSSGGAAVAVSAGFTSFEIGTDIGGSIRIPAAYCGVFGHKPSFGVVPSTGYLDHVGGGTTEADVNVVGPIARSAEDLDLLLSVMARRSAPLVADLPAAPDDLSTLRVAAWIDDEFCPVDPDVYAVLDQAVARLEASGFTVDRHARPAIDPKVASDLGGLLVNAATELPGSTDGPSHRVWGDWHIERQAIRSLWAEFFLNHDIVLMLVAFVPPFEHVQEGTFATRTLRCNDEVRPYFDIVRWTLLTGMAYLPSSVPPIGFTESGLPIGMQVVGRYGSDRTTIAMAGRISELSGGYVPPPIACL